MKKYYNALLQILNSFTVPSLLLPAGLIALMFATPAIVENNLYIRTSEHLYAFGT